MTKATGKINSTYKLTAEDRHDIALMLMIGKISRYPERWSKAAIGRAYGVSRRTVYDVEQRMSDPS